MSFKKIKPYIPGRCMFAYMQLEWGENAGLGKAFAAIVLDLALYGSLVFASIELMSCGCNLNSNISSKKQDPSVVTVPWKGSYTGSESGVGVALGDVDGDGLNDLVVGHPTEVTYFRNTGNGKFVEQQKVCVPWKGSYTGSESGVGVTLGDVNGDKTLDLVVGHPTEVKVFLNKDGVFEELKGE
ncbi:VCBS repeat-containing protein [Candidatus Woesearchaeota archaeon]|nr:VCBS repeat-containing protein [Candidatus Woesearchaeota archaeon]